MLEGTLLDKGLHMITVVAATGLFTVSYTAYKKQENKKFLYILLAFAVFALKETLIAINSLHVNSATLTTAAHLLNLAILGLFYRGTVQ
ncbi:hypothetical protein AQV86_01175 [Nanohaloarchaea archaeon SG9]|nr:hypothetical protein AQV86_01175 [Nanohaloarchaea archaeon SG9]